tara:strand:- start:81 stop:782 length:702 start_codon:yes stop_codon:yes gene_type:complete
LTYAEGSKLNLVDIRDIRKSYLRGGYKVDVLKGISLQVDQAGFTALMGPSGSGKSTLLNLIAGIDKPDSGTLKVDGLDICDLSEGKLANWRAQNIGFVFQFYNLMPVLTAEQNVELPLILSDLNAKDRRAKARFMLEMVGLNDRLAHYPNELSGGQQQRVAIARAIVTDPTLIVADEPTGDLDRRAAEDVLELLHSLNEEAGKTIIMVTHDLEATQNAKEVVYLDKGELVKKD